MKAFVSYLKSESPATAKWFNRMDRTAERSALEPWPHVQIQWSATAPSVVASPDGAIGGCYGD